MAAQQEQRTPIGKEYHSLETDGQREQSVIAALKFTAIATIGQRKKSYQT